MFRGTIFLNAHFKLHLVGAKEIFIFTVYSAGLCKKKNSCILSLFKELGVLPKRGMSLILSLLEGTGIMSFYLKFSSGVKSIALFKRHFK